MLLNNIGTWPQNAVSIKNVLRYLGQMWTSDGVDKENKQ